MCATGGTIFETIESLPCGKDEPLTSTAHAARPLCTRIGHVSLACKRVRSSPRAERHKWLPSRRPGSDRTPHRALKNHADHHTPRLASHETTSRRRFRGYDGLCISAASAELEHQREWYWT
jgi:hypothetical protein